MVHRDPCVMWLRVRCSENARTIKMNAAAGQFLLNRDCTGLSGGLERLPCSRVGHDLVANLRHTKVRVRRIHPSLGIKKVRCSMLNILSEVSTWCVSKGASPRSCLSPLAAGPPSPSRSPRRRRPAPPGPSTCAGPPGTWRKRRSGGRSARSESGSEGPDL